MAAPKRRTPYRQKPRIIIGQRVDQERDRKGMSRRELADALGVDPSVIRAWAAGKSSPRNLEAVADALGCTPAYLWRAA